MPYGTYGPFRLISGLNTGVWCWYRLACESFFVLFSFFECGFLLNCLCYFYFCLTLFLLISKYTKPKPKKAQSSRWFCNYCCIFSCKWDNAFVMVLCDYHYTNNMELLIVWQFPFSLSVCPQSLLVPGFLRQFSLTGWCKWWLQNVWLLQLLPSRLVLPVNLGACVHSLSTWHEVL